MKKYYIAETNKKTRNEFQTERKFLVSKDGNKWYLIKKLASNDRNDSFKNFPYELAKRDKKTLKDYYDMTPITNNEAFLEMV